LYRKKLITSLALPTPIEEIFFDGNLFYLKRDDLIHPDFSGNKARKFYAYLSQEFQNIEKIVSYGSNQSNAMYSLSVLAKLQGWKFEYSVDHIPAYLKENPHGNYKRALKNGMVITETIDRTNSQNILYIEEGGREHNAEYGIKILAQEIETWKESKGIEKLDIFLPSGTGTTALYLQKNYTNRVYTTPCVGDSSYLQKQFLMLESNREYHPTILDTEKKYHFGKLYKNFYTMWQNLYFQTGIEFDLLYDPKGWIVLLENRELFSKPILYIHQGGVIGNESMLLRYERKYKNIL